MRNVAADRDVEAFDPALVAADRQRIEQRLSRMLMRAVAGIDHRAIDLAGEKMHGAGLGMADDDEVRPHRIERDGGVDQRLALFQARGLHRHVHDVGAEPFAGELERRLRARRGFEEEIDQGPAAQGRALFLDLPGDFDRLFGAVEENHNVFG